MAVVSHGGSCSGGVRTTTAAAAAAAAAAGGAGGGGGGGGGGGRRRRSAGSASDSCMLSGHGRGWRRRFERMRRSGGRVGLPSCRAQSLMWCNSVHGTAISSPVKANQCQRCVHHRRHRQYYLLSKRVLQWFPLSASLSESSQAQTENTTKNPTCSNDDDEAFHGATSPSKEKDSKVRLASANGIHEMTQDEGDEGDEFRYDLAPIEQEVCSVEDQICMPACILEEMRTDVVDTNREELCFADSVYNYEDSWLRFNWRVLHMARQSATPTFERLRYIGITASNNDEFFAKRVGGLKRQEEAGIMNLKKRKSYMWTPSLKLAQVTKVMKTFVNCQEDCLENDVLPALQESGIKIVRSYDSLSEREKKRLSGYYADVVEKMLTPLAVDTGHPFPTINSLHLSIAVELQYVDPNKSQEIQFEIIKVPSPMVSRWVPVDNKNSSTTSSPSSMTNVFLPLEELILAHLGSLTVGMRIISKNVFRVTRNADIERHEDEADDLMMMMSEEVKTRKFAPFVRLEVDEAMPERVINILEENLNLPSSGDDTYRTKSFLGLSDLMSLPVKFREKDRQLQFRPFQPQIPGAILEESARIRKGNVNMNQTTSAAHVNSLQQASTCIFSTIRQRDILVHHPYHSFKSTVQLFFEQAADDPNVKVIRTTLYRTSKDSPIISALVRAAEKGIYVFILVEIKARFDEARNLKYLQKLKDSGANVGYGLVGLKTHSKTSMVTRCDEDGIYRDYVHIGTGNYNPVTAEIYSDCGVLSCNTELARDTRTLFKRLMGKEDQSYNNPGLYRHLLVAPDFMLHSFVDLIRNEEENAMNGRPAAIHAKMNGLDEPEITNALYDASTAGVKIRLIVRGVCRPRAGVRNLSENIRICSIIGRFLEHHRIFRFENNGKPLYFLGSADWMSRNLRRRTEACVPIIEPQLQEELQDILDGCLCDGKNAWELLPSGHYVYPPPESVLDDAIEDAISRRSSTISDSSNVDSVWLRAREIGSQAALLEANDNYVS